MKATSAWLFPGQGSQYPSMGRSIWNREPAYAVLEAAESVSGLPLRSVMANGPEALLRSPRYLEPSVVALQIAYVLVARSNGLEPEAVAGYSLGEMGALYCAGCLSMEAALKLASVRGKILQQQAESGSWRSLSVSFPRSAQPVELPASPGEHAQDGRGVKRPGERAAVFLSHLAARSRALCASEVFTAAFNSPRDFTITGIDENVRDFEKRLLAGGASFSPVAIDGPWHSPLAAAAANQSLELLRTIEFKKPCVPVCLASCGRFEMDCESLRISLARGIETPVLWAATVEALWQAGVRRTLEIAPGRVLTGFLRSNWRDRFYSAHFLERENGRAFDFEAFKTTQAAFLPHTDKEASWKISA